MTDDPIAARFRDLKEKLAAAAANPDVGEADVRPLMQEFDALLRDSGVGEQAERQRRLRQYHWSGRAVDLPPPGLADLIRLYRPSGRPFPRI